MIKIKAIPENIGEYLKYDDTSPTGLRWIQKLCYKINIGNPAGGLDNHTNYYYTTFAGKRYINHRIIFFLHFGYCPEIIDHIDGIRTNNRISNLRAATLSQNNCNTKLRKDNSSGHKGVSLRSKGKYQYWRVLIWKNRKLVINKTFPLSEFQSACNYADEQRAVIHGEFSNNGENNVNH